METGSYEHRFGGIQRLYGVRQAEKLKNSRVLVVGIGGVGSWAVEALARSGVGAITMMDWDDVCMTNINRQLPAMSGTVGKAKVDVMADRIRAINPECQVEPVRDFFSSENAEEVLERGWDYVIDAIDSVDAKCLLLYLCRRKKIPVIGCGGAGGRIDPTRIEVCDMSRSYQDPLLARVRQKLRQDYNFPRNPKRKFRVWCVFTPEDPLYPQPDGTVCDTKAEGTSTRLDCASGYGTATFITGTFGFAAAAHVVRKLAESAE